MKRFIIALIISAPVFAHARVTPIDIVNLCRENPNDERCAINTLHAYEVFCKTTADNDKCVEDNSMLCANSPEDSRCVLGPQIGSYKGTLDDGRPCTITLQPTSPANVLQPYDGVTNIDKNVMDFSLSPIEVSDRLVPTVSNAVYLSAITIKPKVSYNSLTVNFDSNGRVAQFSQINSPFNANTVTNNCRITN
jgi:hypothetical protein